MQQKNPHWLLSRARELRKRQTKAERLLWAILRGRRLHRLKFRRQFPIEPFIADFACSEKRLVIEVDGGYHDYRFVQDKSRQDQLVSRGWRVLRFRNEEVLQDLNSVAREIARTLEMDSDFESRERC